MWKNGKYGEWALVTGASDGIGKSLAEELAKKGVNLVLVARREAALIELGEKLARDHSIKFRAIAADVSAHGANASILEQTEDLDIGLLVAAAGFGSTGRFTQTSVENELNMIDVNCRAVVELTHAMAHRLLTRGSGGIVLFGSLLGFQGVGNSANYSATKAFMQSFSEGLHIELKPAKIDVLSCAPGQVESGFASRASMALSMHDKPQRVAKVSLAALGRQSTVRPGFVSKFFGYSLGMLPRALRTRILTRIIGGLAEQG
ncbi:MAG: SDR family NAD(P)-dependent oxidoreductase [Pseudomonadota bacterium]